MNKLSNMNMLKTLLKEKNVAFESDGRLKIKLTQFGLCKTAPIVESCLDEYSFFFLITTEEGGYIFNKSSEEWEIIEEKHIKKVSKFLAEKLDTHEFYKNN